MDADTTEAHLRRPIWVVGHSYPPYWVSKLSGALDPRHPTRHSIWTSVLDYLQDQVYARAGLRLNVTQCYVFNAAAKQPEMTRPDWEWKGTSIPARIRQLASYLKLYKPPVVVTFSTQAFVFASRANANDFTPRAPAPLPTVADLGAHFRQAIASFNPQGVNIFPLLHAYAARGGWHTVGPVFSQTQDPSTNYFEYSGRALGDLLVEQGRELPIWSPSAS